ncbi:cobalamin biosynthesis protein [Spirulina subsalsa]|uniref:cobalamin biosynthesis protein n=1 Tax=Spirulina subsalsa TaxID=54311 RepID=UPI0002FD7531|nr:cobalamin biosynthesis protein [Spirulina subsalsa]
MTFADDQPWAAIATMLQFNCILEDFCQENGRAWLWVGMGCQQDTDGQLMAEGVEQVFRDYDLAPEAIAGIATLDVKAKETGILALCRDRHFPLQTFTRQQLQGIRVPTASGVVQQKVGIPSVAEAAALCAAGGEGARLLVPKQIIKQAGRKGSLTLAVALSSRANSL